VQELKGQSGSASRCQKEDLRSASRREKGKGEKKKSDEKSIKKEPDFEKGQND